MTLAETILDLFRGRDDVVAISNVKPDGKSTFEPHELGERLPAEWLDVRHLGGERCLGFYLMREDNRVWCTCVDFDHKPEHPDPEWRDKAERLYLLLCNVGLHPLVEVSQSGTAAHVWLFFSQPVDAWLVRAFWRGVSRHLELPMPEVYPRQDQLTGKGYGNLVRYPLWNESYFPDVEDDWKPIDPDVALAGVRKADGYDLQTVAHGIGAGELRSETILATRDDGSGISYRIKTRLQNAGSLLAKRWAGDMTGMQDGSRSALVQSIACELVRTYVPTVEIEQALRSWCREHGYDKGERDDWIPRTVAKAYDFVTSRVESKSVETATLRDSVLEYIDSLKLGKKPHIPTGIWDLDAAIDGISPGEMAVIAARPSHGKSAFGLHWLATSAMGGLAGLIISEEMSRLELAKRTVLTFSDVPEEQWTDSIDAIRSTAEAYFQPQQKIFVVENCSSIDRCDAVIDQHCGLYNVKIVAVDYLQLLSSKASSRYEEVTEISRRLKQAAKRNDCAVIALCQLNREVDKRDGHEPKLSDLRESGQIEQDADLILFLQWCCKYDANASPDDYLVYAAKRRNGPIREQCVKIAFDAPHQRFGARKVPYEETIM